MIISCSEGKKPKKPKQTKPRKNFSDRLYPEGSMISNFFLWLQKQGNVNSVKCQKKYSLRKYFVLKGLVAFVKILSLIRSYFVSLIDRWNAVVNAFIFWRNAIDVVSRSVIYCLYIWYLLHSYFYAEGFAFYFFFSFLLKVCDW